MSDWRSRRACKNLSPAESDKLFFPNNCIIPDATKRMCGDPDNKLPEFRQGTCPVRKECEDFGAKHSNGYGIWGGRWGTHIWKPEADDSLDSYLPVTPVEVTDDEPAQAA